MRIFAGFLDAEVADRLAPDKTETPKSRENSRFWAGSDYARHPTVDFSKQLLRSIQRMIYCFLRYDALLYKQTGQQI